VVQNAGNTNTFYIGISWVVKCGFVIQKDGSNCLIGRGAMGSEFGRMSLIGGTVTAVTECNCRSNSLVEWVGFTEWREQYLVDQIIIKIETMTG